MATNLKDYMMGKKPVHVVGQVNSWDMETYINGAVVKEAKGVDNFCVVELFFEDGEAKVRYAGADAKAEDMMLTVTPEVRLEGEMLSDFYNGNGERATVAYLKEGFTFQTSKIVASTVAIGDKVVWDGATKAFIKGDTGEKVFRVTDIETDPMYSIDELELVQLTVLK